MSEPTIGTGRHAAPRRRRGIWIAAGILVALVVAGSAGIGGTYALWNGKASTNASTVTSGTAAVQVSALSTMNASSLAPGTGVTGTFSVKNSGTIPLSMRVSTTATSVAYATSATDATVLGELTLRLSVVASAADCKTGLGGASGRVAAFDTGAGYYTLPVGASGVGCVELDLDADAPQSVAGAVTNFTLTVTGTQVTT
ncbi:hypothetical protein GCM10025867_15920 [Frondihabitans sucicola]|uniref:Camelysin metallo-endopeptidase n=1 Tax=Frondihabitans sucicola TaxID=1268041 RepID=A0ABM8GLR7_9MICO|nr:TasA family protein [Frondihabitans sucicola]BDZ49351.1 hypothetical protein GCM10025867_15920 [Frondihabitans sucicola]